MPNDETVNGGPPPPNYLRAWRLYRGLSQIQVQQRLGWSEGRVSKLESGTVPVKPSTLAALARLYGCDLGDLFRPPPEPAAHGLLGIIEVRQRLARLQHDVAAMKRTLVPLIEEIEQQIAEAGAISEAAAQKAEELTQLFVRYAAEIPSRPTSDD